MQSSSFGEDVIDLSEKKLLLYVQTSGINTPERLYSPFVLAQTAKAMGLDAKIYFLGMGLTVLRKGEAEKIRMGTFPLLKEVINQTIKAGVEILVCQQSQQLLNVPAEELVPEAKIVGAATLNGLVLEADGVMWF